MNHYPELNGHIRGELYNPPFYAVALERGMAFVQLFAMLTITFGDSMWNLVPFLNGPPQFYLKLKENPMAGAMLVFFVVPSIVQSFLNTGAFEIVVDGDVVYSKLEQGRMPNGEDVIKAFTKIGFGVEEKY